MILQEISAYVKEAGRIEEKKLLKHFRLSSEGLAPMMSVLLKRGKIQKTIILRGEKLSPEIYYSWTETAQIPTLTVI
jgi:hypothetical protein